MCVALELPVLVQAASVPALVCELLLVPAGCGEGLQLSLCAVCRPACFSVKGHAAALRLLPASVPEAPPDCAGRDQECADAWTAGGDWDGHVMD